MIKIKNAMTYNAQLPAAQALEDHLKQFAFKEPLSLDLYSAGFEPVLHDKLVETFPGGLAFKLRYDEKIIPASVTTELAKKRIEEIEKAEDRRLPGKERNRIRDEIVNELLPKALCQTKRITCLYRIDDHYLIVPTTSKKLADIVTTRLIKAVGSIKATTIYISDIKSGLTGKLHDYIGDCAEGNEHAFSDFSVGGVVKLKHEEGGKTAQFKLDEVKEAKNGIIEAIRSGARVVELELCTDVVEFRINADFVLKGIDFLAEPNESEFDSEIDHFRHEASVQSLMLSDVIKKLCTVFEYKEPEQANEQKAA